MQKTEGLNLNWIKDEKILVFSGPSGAGKSTLIKYLLDNLKSADLTVSCTTRSPRTNEKDGVDYHFITHEKFESLITQNEFIEYVNCYGNRYGTLKKSVNDVLEKNDICILDLDFEGAYNVLSNKIFEYNCLGILILPPSLKTLKERLQNRNSETIESLELRLRESFQPKRIAKYDCVIINKDLENSKSELINKIRSLKLL